MEWLVISAIVTSLGGFISYAVWRGEKYERWLQQIRTEDTLFYTHTWDFFHYRIDTPHQSNTRWSQGVLITTHKRIALYQYPQLHPLFTIQPHELRGFWRPEKYSPGQNEIWVHAQIGVTWYILKLRLSHSKMTDFVRVMKDISTDVQVKAYRRRRPYIHRGLSLAHPAQQNLHGAWELDAPLHLYLMPLHLVVLHNNAVQNVLDLADIQTIAALKRIEGGKPEGLIRFIYGEETYAFAMDDYEVWASDLAEAAKRTLEEPVVRKRKGKDDDDDYDE